MRGTYYDGDTAQAHDVEVEAAPGGLRITGDQVDVTWAYDSLMRVGNERRRDRIRISPGPEREERLVLKGGTDADRQAIESHAPHLFDLSRVHARGRRVVIGLVSAAAAIAAFVFWGLPAISGPAARMSPPEWESALGESVSTYMDMFTDQCSTTQEAQAVLDALGGRLADQADLVFDLRFELVDAEFPNAMAFPAGRIIVTDDLLELMDGPDELAGVLAHEIAHVSRRHVMASVMRDVGFGIVLGLAVGGSSGAGGELVGLGGEVASLGHSRAAEREADELGLDYLEAAGLNPGGLASFFDKIAEISGDDLTRGDRFAELLVTHPNAAERADAARTRAMPEREPALSQAEWDVLLSACGLSTFGDSDDEQGDEEPLSEAEAQDALEFDADPPDGEVTEL